MTKQSPERTWRDHVKNLSLAFLMVFGPLLLLDVLLRVADPWGLVYFDDSIDMFNAMEWDDQRIAVLPDGDYQFSHWSATVRDGVRVTPATNPNADCELVMIGDSVTFGYGVDDEDVWVNLLAQEFPDVTFINTGTTFYASVQVLGTYQAYPDGDAYLYLVFTNDWDGALNPQVDWEKTPFWFPKLVSYINFYRLSDLQGPETPPTLEETERWQPFFSHLDVLTADERVTVASFRDFTITQAALNAGYDISVLGDYPTEQISFADFHPNEAGNRYIADELRPIIEDMIAQHCSAG